MLWCVPVCSICVKPHLCTVCNFCGLCLPHAGLSLSNMCNSLPSTCLHPHPHLTWSLHLPHSPPIPFTHQIHPMLLFTLPGPIQSSTAKYILLESCQFVHYCQHLLQSKEAHVVSAVKQLHMHVQRVALSVVFVSNIDSADPARSASQSPEPDSPSKEHAPEPGMDLGATHTTSHFAQAVTKVGLVPSLSNLHPAPRRAPTPTNIWQVLPLGEVHSRLQRLALLMDLSEPGTVPEPNLLASLLDFVSEAKSLSRHGLA